MSAAAQIREIPLPCEEHYTVLEVAGLWKVSDDKVREVFEHEPGVLVLGSPRSNGRKRRYVTLRIPKSVFERVYRRLQLQGGE